MASEQVDKNIVATSEDLRPRTDAGATSKVERSLVYRTDEAVQQSGAEGRPGISHPGTNQRFQLTGEQFTKYRNSTPERRQRKPRVSFNFMCGKCTRLVCAGKDVRVFMGRHHPVLDPTFVERIKVYRHWKPLYLCHSKPSLNKPIEKKKKISCIDCGSDWGAGFTIDGKYFFFIKVETLRVQCSDTLMTYKRWRDFPYHMDAITDSELVLYGHARIPDDSPWPEGWY